MDAECEDNSYRVMVAVGFSIGITVIAIILRLLARKIQHVPLGADHSLLWLERLVLISDFSCACADGQ